MADEFKAASVGLERNSFVHEPTTLDVNGNQPAGQIHEHGTSLEPRRRVL